MPTTPKFALFDVDGTIAHGGQVSAEVLAGFEHLHSLGCMTTLSTGRGYVRLKDVLGAAFDKLVSPGAPVILEHGTKILSRDGELIFGDFFSETEIEHVVDFIRANIGIVKLVSITTLNINQKVKVWCADERDVQSETDYRGHYAEVFHASIGELRELLLAEQLTNVNARLKAHVQVENLKLAFTRTATNVLFLDGNMEFVKANTNKGLAVLYAAKHVNVRTADILLAGNAINDVEMLDLDVGTSILVSPLEKRGAILSYLSSPETIVRVDTPEALGKYLSGLK